MRNMFKNKSDFDKFMMGVVVAYLFSLIIYLIIKLQKLGHIDFGKYVALKFLSAYLITAIVGRLFYKYRQVNSSHFWTCFITYCIIGGLFIITFYLLNYSLTELNEVNINS